MDDHSQNVTFVGEEKFRAQILTDLQAREAAGTLDERQAFLLKALRANLPLQHADLRATRQAGMELSVYNAAILEQFENGVAGTLAHLRALKATGRLSELQSQLLSQLEAKQQ